jgi:hypothetical protein
MKIILLIIPQDEENPNGTVYVEELSQVPQEPHYHLTDRVYKVVLQKSIPAQIRQLIKRISNDKG